MIPKHERRVLAAAARGALDEWLSQIEHGNYHADLTIGVDYGQLILTVTAEEAASAVLKVHDLAKKSKSMAARAVRKLLEETHGGERDIEADRDDRPRPDLDETRSGADRDGPEDDRDGRSPGHDDEDPLALRSREAWPGLSGVGLKTEILLSIGRTRDAVKANLGADEYALRVDPVITEMGRLAQAKRLDVVAVGFAAACRAEDLDPDLAMLYSCALADILEERGLDLDGDAVLSAALEELVKREAALDNESEAA